MEAEVDEDDKTFTNISLADDTGLSQLQEPLIFHVHA